ncbi:MAG: RnfABCDGE type electron transport complex subunit B [Deltaproteobacteria bacterium]|nr:RnfABCDGE type electron transport complex subunit B [Deltaproteobacteria bacterium]
MFTALLTMGGLGVLVGAGLAVASKIFYVYVDPKVEAVDEALPGANCGGCGYPGCSSTAAAIVAGEASPSACVAGGPELAEQIAGILGVAVSVSEPDVARPGCYYGVADADTLYLYEGAPDCRAAALLSGGMKVCRVGCLGLGTCAAACPFDALSMGPDGLPVVDEQKCTGCGTCERVCPKGIIRLSSLVRRIMREYTTEECTTPCQRACPAGLDIREYMKRAAEGDFEGSLLVIKERNPFPATIGRICPHPCETACRRNLVDEAVAINPIKRCASDLERSAGRHILPKKAPETGRRVAVAGGGIEGLSAAYFLARLGHAPTVLEATDRLGGLLRTAIPAERLPAAALDWDIEGILEMGVDAKTNTALGRDATISALLQEGYDAVFVASGGWDSRLGRNPSAGPEKVLPGVFLLIDAVRAESREKLDFKDNAVFAGGGKTAVSAAMEVASKNKVVLLRTARGEAGVDEALVSQAREKGVEILFNTAVTRLFGEDRSLQEVEVMDLGSCEKKTIPADRLVVAAGRVPELVFVRQVDEEQEGEAALDQESLPPEDQDTDGPIAWVAVPPYKKPAADLSGGLLSPADELTDYAAAVEAVGAGRRGAASVQMVMNGQEPALPENVITPTVRVQDVAELSGVSPKHREPLAAAGPGEMAPGVERETGYTRETARREARRCLQCGLVCYEADAKKTA